jgi:hypothetical protein
MSFSAFSSFLHKLAFQHSKSQLKSLPFVPASSFSAFWLEKPTEKQEQTGPKIVLKILQMSYLQWLCESMSHLIP